MARRAFDDADAVIAMGVMKALGVLSEVDERFQSCQLRVMQDLRALGQWDRVARLLDRDSARIRLAREATR